MPSIHQVFTRPVCIRACSRGQRPGPGQPTSSGGGGTRGGGPSGAMPLPAPSSGPAMTAALQAGRVSALVSSAGCAPDETVLNLFTEQNFQDASERFVHVQWRSVSEIFDYLGAVLRYQARARKPFNLVWTNKQDSTIRHDPVLHTIPLPKEQDSTLTPTPIFFAVYSDGSSNIRASYNGESVAPNKVEAMQPTADNTMSILRCSARSSITRPSQATFRPLPHCDCCQYRDRGDRLTARARQHGSNERCTYARAVIPLIVN